jgi:quinol monooxygenase YgiN
MRSPWERSDVAVRIIVTIYAPSADAAAAGVAERVELCRRAESEEEGCLQYEVFHSAVHPERFVLCELWADRAVYDKHWNLQQQRERDRAKPPPPAPGVPGRRSTVEIYEQHVYKNVDGIWMAADEHQRSTTIRWLG